MTRLVTAETIKLPLDKYLEAQENCRGIRKEYNDLSEKYKSRVICPFNRS